MASTVALLRTARAARRAVPPGLVRAPTARLQLAGAAVPRLRAPARPNSTGGAAEPDAAAAATASSATAQFGFETVGEAEKEEMVKGVFSRVADSYDTMNDLMSAGVHRLWKDWFVAALGPAPGMRVLDVAGGTGDIAFRCASAAAQHEPSRAARTLGVPGDYDGEPPCSVTVCDINPEMLAVGRRRAAGRGFSVDGPGAPPADGQARGGGPAMEFVEGNAERLPFEDASFDAYTIAFGLRNVTHTDAAIREALRVLRPGGRFMCMEFSPVETPGLKDVYDAYSFGVIPALGEFVANDRASYQYLVESIRNFHAPEELAELMEREGFSLVTHTPYTGGIVQVHSGFRLD